MSQRQRPVRRPGGEERARPCRDVAIVLVLDFVKTHERGTRPGDEAERLRAIIAAALDYAIFTTDVEGVIDSWPGGAQAVFGWTAAEAIGEHFAMTFTEEDQERGVPGAELETAARNGSAPDVRWHVRKDRTRVFIDGTTRALHDDAGRVRGYFKIGQDVTHRRSMEQSLQENEARYRALVENVAEHAIFLIDAEGHVTEWPAAAARLIGYSAEEISGKPLATFYAGAANAGTEAARMLAEASAHGRSERALWRSRKGGERYFANDIVTAIRDSDGQLTGFTVITRDLTARRQAEEADARLREAAERDSLRRELLAAEESERRRFARELHDEAGQHLTALGLGLQSLSDVVPPGSEIDRRAARLREVVATLARELHGLAQRLRPKVLDDFGVVPALTTYVEEWARNASIPVDMHIRLDGPRLIPAIETAVYRIIQEALTNVARHSAASRASVIVERRGDSVVAIIEDNGRGFDTAAPPRSLHRTPLGLRGIIERANLLGGMAEIESSPHGGGTTLFVRIPLGDDAAIPASRA